MRYFVVIGQEGAQIQEVPELLAPHYHSYPGFTSRTQAEQCIARLQTPNRYPNSSTHWEEYSTTPPVPIQRPTPSPSPHPPAAQIVTPAPAATNSGPVVLSEEQKHVLQMVQSRENVFFTGPAGTGKSVLLREIIKTLRFGHPPVTVAVTASTGIAGLNIGGSTLHSFAGVGLGKEKQEVLAGRISRSITARWRWKTTEVLIIDEISMIDGKFFDKLEYIARVVRENDSPFGGLQLVLSGDFCQLPPVPEKTSAYQIPSTFAFDAKSWSNCIGKPVLLTHVFRQSDKAFVDILSSMRVGQLSDDHIKSLAALSRPLTYSDGIEPTHLFPTRQEAQGCNTQRLNALSEQGFVYNSMDSSGVNVYGEPLTRQQAERVLDDEIALSKITLKVGAQVMLIQNIVPGCLVNGSCGKVIDFMTTHEALQKHIQIAEMKKKERQEELEKIHTKRPRIEPETFQPLNDCQFDKNDKWPLVSFTSGMLLLCAPVDFCVEGFLGNVEAKRIQVPLILAWALSMHKSQGQTLERVKVDLGKVFEKGQAYVAISRATTMEHLEIVNFNPLKVEAHPRVIAWQNGWMPSSASGSSVVAPRRVTVTALPNPHSSPRQSDEDEVDPDQTLWDAEMDCDEAISNYHDNPPE